MCVNIRVLFRGPEMVTEIANTYMLYISLHIYEIPKGSVPFQKKECKGLCIETD